MTTPSKTSVAVLGGGCGAMAAVFALTATAELQARYDVTVYQLGWRLGGKGASGRNAQAGQRIEEHGLHMWLGFYDDAFRVMRECYAEWNGPVPFAQAFIPQRLITLQELVGTGPAAQWETWNVQVPVLPGEPGVDGPPLLVELLDGLFDALTGHYATAGLKDRAAAGFHALTAARAHLGTMSEDPSRHAPHDRQQLLAHIETARASVAAAPALSSLDDFMRRARLLVELGLAIAKGFVSDVLPYGDAGYDRINDVEFRAWLESHGASPDVSFSAPVRALYDLGFAYAAGVADRDHAQAAAGVALRVMLSIAFGSRGAPLWKMYAGMGDTVFTPFHEVLKARGVHFKFFHRVRALHLSPSGALVQRVELSRQVDVLAGAQAYDPFVPVAGIPAWPSDALWPQIRDGQAVKARLDAEGITLESPRCTEEVERVTLELGRDFDLVLLGISLGGLPDVCGELLDASESWRSMVANVPTVGTQAFQVWLNKPLAELGWTAGPTVMTSYAEPFDTWGEMSHLIPREAWPPQAGVQSIHYFCGAMPDHAAPASAPGPLSAAELDVVVRDRARAWLEERIAHLWPSTMAGGTFDWNLLVDLNAGVGPARFDAQFFRSNLGLTERYVLSPPGSIRFRLPQRDADFGNLFLAGDWTRTRYNSGCVEAAVDSGLRAAAAIDAYPSFPTAAPTI